VNVEDEDDDKDDTLRMFSCNALQILRLTSCKEQRNVELKQFALVFTCPLESFI